MAVFTGRQREYKSVIKANGSLAKQGFEVIGLRCSGKRTVGIP
jgi:hypothetical protein